MPDYSGFTGNDRLAPQRSPISEKYRRVLDGMELLPSISSLTSTPIRNDGSGGIGSTTNNKIGMTNTSPQLQFNPQEFYDGVFGSLLGPTNGGFLVKPNINTVTSSPIQGGLTTHWNIDHRGIRTYGDLHTKPNGFNQSHSSRPLMTTPIRILDAPGLEDDFYLNLVDWEPRENMVTVLLDGEDIYFWDAATAGKEIINLGRNNNQSNGNSTDRGCVVKWSTSGSPRNVINKALLGVGTSSGRLEIWDCGKLRSSSHQASRSTASLLHQLKCHNSRLGVLSWQTENTLTSGSRDHHVVHYDLRVPGAIVIELTGHRQEICGLKWDHGGSGLLASGGNDNELLVWDLRKTADESGNAMPLLQLNQHTAAVKALDWSPHHAGLLASGGGTADRTIRFWNTKTATSTFPSTNVLPEPFAYNEASFRPIQTTSQICTLAWSPFSPGEILSTHGFSEHNLNLWSYPSGRHLGQFQGHAQRVLYQAVSPDGSTVVTGSGDETLRFWNVFRRRGGFVPGVSPKNNFRFIAKRDEDNLENVFNSSR